MKKIFAENYPVRALLQPYAIRTKNHLKKVN